MIQFPKHPPRPTPVTELTEADIEAYFNPEGERPTVEFDCIAFFNRVTEDPQ